MYRIMMKYALGAAALALLLTGASVVARAADDSNQQLSGKDAKRLMGKATSVQEYRQLATYFEQQAKALELQAAYYSKQADDYPSSTGIHPKVPYAGGWGLHCRYLASQYSLDAQKAHAHAEKYRALAEGGHSGATTPGSLIPGRVTGRVVLAAWPMPLPQHRVQDAVSSGTIIPVRLESRLNSEKNKPGDTVTARVMQDVTLTTGGRIRAGSKLTGHLTRVVDAGKGRGGKISFAFDEFSSQNANEPIHVYLRALASNLEVEEAQMPSAYSEEANPESSWTVEQVGGDVVYRGGGVVMRGPDVVGKPRWPSDDVIEFDHNHRAQAVWVFSLNASGAYGFSHTQIAQSGRTNPSSAITLSAQSGNVNVGRGTGMLLVSEP